jgi:hypothetical protein
MADITDDFMQDMLGKSKGYTLVILKFRVTLQRPIQQPLPGVRPHA